jgi:hypothetical protein
LIERRESQQRFFAWNCFSFFESFRSFFTLFSMGRWLKLNLQVVQARVIDVATCHDGN